MPAKPVTKRELDSVTAGGCQAAGCDHSDHADVGPLFLHPRCHLGAAVEASYLHGSGVLRIACRRCHKVVADVKVAEESS